jgi:hypothetical protein
MQQFPLLLPHAQCKHLAVCGTGAALGQLVKALCVATTNKLNRMATTARTARMYLNSTVRQNLPSLLFGLLDLLHVLRLVLVEVLETALATKLDLASLMSKNIGFHVRVGPNFLAGNDTSVEGIGFDFIGLLIGFRIRGQRRKWSGNEGGEKYRRSQGFESFHNLHARLLVKLFELYALNPESTQTIFAETDSQPARGIHSAVPQRHIPAE